MDTILIRYSAFIADLLDMDDVHYIHVIKEFDVPKELVDEFPELDQPLDEILREELTETITQELDQLRLSYQANDPCGVWTCIGNHS